jgi:hypothetical protein
MNRTQQILVGLLALQIVLILVVRSPFAHTTDGSSLRPLLPGLDAFTPARIELLGGEDGATVNLRKQDGQWTIAEAGGYPADTSKIDELLNDLKQIRVRRPVVSSGRYHSAFKVEDNEFEGRIRIYDDSAADKPEVDLILGDSPNYRITHARIAGEDPVYEVRDLAPYDVRAAVGSWADKELVQIPVEHVVELEVENDSGSFRLVKGPEGWSIAEPASLADTTLDTSKVEGLIRAAAALRIDQPVGPLDEAAQGLNEPAATVTLRYSSSGEPFGSGDESPAVDEVVVRIGGKVPDKDTQRYVTRSGFDYTATVFDSSVSKLVDQKPGDLAASS